jgi:hypothetical protein
LVDLNEIDYLCPTNEPTNQEVLTKKWQKGSKATEKVTANVRAMRVAKKLRYLQRSTIWTAKKNPLLACRIENCRFSAKGDGLETLLLPLWCK